MTSKNTTYKDSPLGKIPKDWEIFELGKVVEFLDVKRRPIKDEERGKIQGIYPYYGASGVIDYVNDYLFNEELILLGEDGANIINRSTPLAFKVTGKIWVNNHAHVLRPKNGFNIGYLTEFLESIKYDKFNTGTAQPKLNKEICSSIPILCPSLPEQKLIAEVFTSWDEAITKTNQLINQKELLKKWLMRQLLTGKKRFPAFKNATLRKNGLNTDWQEVRMSDVFERVTRKNNEANTNVVTISAQRGFVKQEDFFKKLVASDILDNYFLVGKGEFCYNKSYSNGYPWGATKRLKDFDKAVVTTLYICFALKDSKAHSGYFFENYFEANLLDRGLTQIAHEGGRAHGLLNVTPSDFFDLSIVIPPLAEQIAIAKVLQTSNKEIQLLKAKLEMLKEQKKGLMQVLLTGKKRLSYDI